MLEIRDLHVAYGKHAVLRGVDLQLERGESLAIIGESGAGKSTLAHSILGLLCRHQAEQQGMIRVNRKSLHTLDPAAVRDYRWKDAALVMQNAAGAFTPQYRMLDQIIEPYIHKKMGSKQEARERALELLDAVAFPCDRADAYPHQLSVGERQKAMIAMALICDPQLLILDEPTASLDQDSKARVVAALADLRGERTTMLITHDLALPPLLTRRSAVLYGGRILELGDTDAVLAAPRHPYTRGLVRSFPDPARTKDLQGMRGHAAAVSTGCPYAGRCTQHLPTCSRTTPTLQAVDDRHIACHRQGVIARLELKRISKRYGDREILRNVSLELYEGETLALIGPSGAGKSTLGRIVLGEACDAGEIRFDGGVVDRRTPELRRAIQMIYQDPLESLPPHMSILDCVTEPLDILGIGSRAERRAKAEAVLREVQLPPTDDLANALPAQLSGGEVQRVVIARALVVDPKLLIADEPTAALDPSVQAKVMKLLNQIQEDRGLAILFITHDLPLARKVSDRICTLANVQD